MKDPSRLVHKGIQQLTPYVPGKPIEELEREFGVTGAIKMASNENPLGPSPKALEAIKRTLPSLHRYPDADAFELKQKLADRHRTDRVAFSEAKTDFVESILRKAAAEGFAGSA